MPIGESTMVQIKIRETITKLVLTTAFTGATAASITCSGPGIDAVAPQLGQTKFLGLIFVFTNLRIRTIGRIYDRLRATCVCWGCGLCNSCIWTKGLAQT